MLKKKLNNSNIILFFGIFFLTFLGYFTILLVLFDAGMSELSRKITIPLRLFIIGMLLILLWKNRENLRESSGIKWSLFFFLVFSFRLLIEYLRGINYYMSILDVFLYFIAFCVFPFMGIVFQQITLKRLNIIFNSFLIGGAVFSILTILSYKQFIGNVGRLASGIVGEAIISPLTLSYCSALTIGVLSFYLLTNSVSFRKRFLMLIVIFLSVIPFFLGASRGSLVAVFVPFIIYFFSGKGASFFLKSFTVLIICLLLFVYLDNTLKSGLLDRFLSISEAIEQGNSSASRLSIWERSFNQFKNNPIFGDSLKVKNYPLYPHNILFEVLQATGIVGFIPFFVLIFKTWKSCLSIFKNHKELIWVAVIFIQSFVQNMFSGAIYNASWFWTSMALVLATDYSLKKSIHEKYV
ncbi:O-antigen ligase family protein [uncultured Marixanthomonas sp.]|uniref:O-antigen ligase family protein n=1 Tax=uncultured Marixanthomonas sp. TaxID=757245 RepID=UPI0030DBEB48|tara:strand:+ start:8182 stop:9408 length:1227 start_codon:yes stop_codon:yes gene_type:complete